MDAVRGAPKHLEEITSIILRVRPGTAPETIRARIYEELQRDHPRLLRVAKGVYVGFDGPACLVLAEGDSWSVIRELPDNAINLLVTDPPFRLGTDWNLGRGMTRIRSKSRTYEQRDLDKAFLEQAFRVIRKHDHEWRKAYGDPTPAKGPGVAMILTPPRTKQTRRHIEALVRLAEEVGFEWAAEFVVDYADKIGGYWPPQQHWLVHVFTAGRVRRGVPWDLSVTSVIRVKRVRRASKAGAKEHEAEKPKDLFLALIRFVTQPGDIVADFFAGRARWARDALRMGRHVLLVEKEAKWIERALQEDWNATEAGAIDLAPNTA